MKKTWMLLLVTVVLAAVLAVPAMAAEVPTAPAAVEHTDHTEWTPLTASTTLENNGKYVLEDALTASFTVPSGTTVTVCLNGKTWSGDGTTRPLTVTGGTVNICDCQYTGKETDTGAIVGADLTAASQNGGAVSVSGGGTVNFCSGIIRGGTAASGGNVAVDGEGSLFNMYGGTITGGKTMSSGTRHGGNVRVSGKAVFNMYNGTVSGGWAFKGGGNFVLATAGTRLNIYGGTITRGESESNGAATAETVEFGGGNIYANQGTVTMTGGTVSSGISAYGGGNVYVHNGSFVLGDASSDSQTTPSITGGEALYGGGVYVNKTFSMKSGKITGGTADYGDAVYVKAGTMTVDGGTIADGTGTASGAAYVAGGTLKVQGKATVQGGTAANGGAVYVDGGTLTVQGSANVKGGTATNGGAVYVAAGTATLKGSATVSGGTAHKGGAVYVAGGTFALSEKATITGGKATSGNSASGGNVAVVGADATFSMTGGTIKGGKADSSSGSNHGGNVRIDGSATFNMSAGLVTGGEAKNGGGNFVLVGSGQLKMTGGSITAGTANGAGDPGGGNVCIYSGTMIMEGGTVSGGTSKHMGGNIHLRSGTFQMKAGVVSGGTATDASNVYVSTASAALTLEGNAQVSGGIDVANAKSVTLKGTPVVDKALTTEGQIPAYSLRLASGKKLVLNELQSGAWVGITCAAPADALAISDSTVTDDCGLFYDDNTYYIQKNTDGKPILKAADGAAYAAVNRGGVAYPLEEAVAMAIETGGYVHLVSSLDGITLSQSVAVDLDGYDITNLTLANDAKLTLFDSQTADYAVAADETSSNGYSGYGKVTLAEGSPANILREANTPKAIYGSNYRFVVLKDDEGYHAHRIYLTVKSTILYPNKPALNYRTALRCDQLVAKYINAPGGGFGVLASGENIGTEYGDYTENGYAALPWDSATQEQNERITQLNDFLKTANTAEENTLRANTKVRAQAYIFLADQFYGSTLQESTDADGRLSNAELIAAKGITSSGVNLSLRNMVETAFAKSMDALTTVTVDALYHMYTKWSTGLMETWSLKNLQAFEEACNGVDLKYGCLCGDPSSTDNPCADAGHARLTWRPWTSTNTFPSESGNYYLKAPLVLKWQGSVAAGKFINLNTNGHNISVEGNRRVANVSGVLNLTNFGIDGGDVPDVRVTATCPYSETKQGDHGGVLLIGAGANVSLYSGVTLAAAENHHAIQGGVLSLNGDVNIYGGRIEGTTLADQGNTDYDRYGGAILVNANGYLYMGSGEIVGGEAACGGAIYSKGTVELAGGTVTGGTAEDNGGMIYVAGGKLYNNGVSLDGSASVAKLGGLMYVAGGEVLMSGDAENTATVTGGTANDGGMIYVAGGKLHNSGLSLDGSASMARRGGLMYVAGGEVVMRGTAENKLTLTGGTTYTENNISSSGSGGVFFVTGGKVDVDHCILNGSLNKSKSTDGTIGNYASKDGHGGTVFYVINGDITVDASELNGYEASTVNKRGGTITMSGGTMTVDGDPNVSGGTTITASRSSINAALLYLTTGTFTINEGTVLDSSNIFAPQEEGGTALNADGITYGSTLCLTSKTVDNTTTAPEFVMNGGTIKGGHVKQASTGTYGGGNLYISAGSFTMNGGTIEGGRHSGTGGGGNVLVTGSARFTMTGGTIRDGVAASGKGGGLMLAGGTLQISGTAQITGNKDSDGNANNVYLPDGKTIALGELASGAKVGVTLESIGGYVTSGNTQNTEDAIQNGRLESDGDLDVNIDSGDSSDFYIGKFSCTCGFPSGEKHIGDCDGNEVLWKPWTDTGLLPETSGYWYLTDDVTLTRTCYVGSGSGSVAIHLDLNGKTVTANDIARIYQTRTDVASGNEHLLSITDSSSGQTGKLVVNRTNEITDQGQAVWLRKAGCVLKLYRGTIDGTNAKLKNSVSAYYEATGIPTKWSTRSGAVIVNDHGQIFIYGGTVIGGTTHAGGGAIASSGDVTMTGGTVVGGTAYCYLTSSATGVVSHNHGVGGAIYMSGGKLSISGDAIIDGGTAGMGGAVKIGSGASLEMTGGTIKNGRADPSITAPNAGDADSDYSPTDFEGLRDCGYGGNLQFEGSVTISGGTIENGEAVAGTGGGLGGNMAVSGILRITGGTVKEGTAATGGNIGTHNQNGDITLGVAEGNVDEKAVQILNGTANNGGNLAINVRPCKSFVINPGTWVEGGRAASNGGNISININQLHANHYKEGQTDYLAHIVVNGGTITNGIAGELGGNVYAKGVSGYSSSNTSNTSVNVDYQITLGADAVLSNGAAAQKGNNLYLDTRGVAVIGGTVKNTLASGTYFEDTDDEYTVSVNSVYLKTNTSRLTLNEGGKILSEKASGATALPYVRNVYMIDGTVNINGGEISGGSMGVSEGHGGNIRMDNGTLTMTGGEITGGSVRTSNSFGGNVYIAGGTATVSGGQISDGLCQVTVANGVAVTSINCISSGRGGNVYIAGGSLTLQGEATVTGGKVASGGGNIFVGGGALNMKENASITNGLSAKSNGGNVFVAGGATFTMDNGTLSGGRTGDSGGNVYVNGTFDMRGGEMTGGAVKLTWSDFSKALETEPTGQNPTSMSANLFNVGGVFSMSGGEIATGVTSNNTSNDSPKVITLSGNCKIGGTGLNLNYSGTGVNTLNIVDGTGLTEGAEIYIYCGKLESQGDYVRLNVELDDPAYVNKLFKEANYEVCQVAYLPASDAPDGVGGVYLYNGEKYRFNCICGANDDELAQKGHLPGCDGTVLQWNAWPHNYLPNEPGNWFLNLGSASQCSITTTALKEDFYRNAQGELVAVRALAAVDENGSFITMENNCLQQAVDSSGNKIWLNPEGTAIDTNAANVLTEYTINVDLNGHKLEGPSNNRNLTFYGRNYCSEKTSSGAVNAEQQALIDSLNGIGVYEETVGKTEAGEDIVSRRIATHRQAKVTYTIVDASQDHTAVLATNKNCKNKNVPQGVNIWMPWQEDTLNIYRSTLDSSSVQFGWGTVLEIQGAANLYDATLIGGVAQGYFTENKLATGTDRAGNTVSGYVKTVGSDVSGGGAVNVCETGRVYMYGGTIKNGTSIYRYMDGSNGVNVERTVGGGNVFVSGIFHVEGSTKYPALITGGKALNYTGEEDYALSSYTAAQGGGVYLSQGQMTVTGNVSIKDNYTGTVTGTVDETNGTGLGIVAIETVNATTPSNLYLGGNIIEAKALTGKVHFTMNPADSTCWEGPFAKVDNNSTTYANNLIPDVTQTGNSVALGDDGVLRFVKNTSTLQVGYGAASIYPTEQDIANGLSLGGYGNNNYKSSGEQVRITRYWQNPTSGYEATDPSYDKQDMKATAMAFRDTEGDTVIIINVDYNSVSESVGNNVKRLVSKATGVPLSNITISASHQHNGPGVAKVYWTNMDGDYTKAPTSNRTSNGSGTYEDMIYSGEKLQKWEPREVRTDYATTFYTGVLNAAKTAYNDLANVTAVTGGIMDTTTGKQQFNFVRNLTLYAPKDTGKTKVVGMITDNHRTTYDDGSYIHDYESKVDVTMQLVKYERSDKTIVLANFQSHPHLGDGSGNLNPTGGVLEVFRSKVSEAYGTSSKPCQVLYFSGAGGNVNSSTSIDGSGYDGQDDSSLQPWYAKSQEDAYKNSSEIQRRVVRVQEYGTALAGLASAYLKSNKMTNQVADLKTANVQVKVQDFEYDVWNEKESYTIGTTTIPKTWSDKKLANAKLLVDWEEGGYLDRPGKFGNSYNYGTTNVSYWQYFNGSQSGNDKLYSFFHANGVRKRLLRCESGETTGHFEITAYDLGGIGFIAAPYEMFQENGQAIKGNTAAVVGTDYAKSACGYIAAAGGTQKSSPYGITIIASQANDHQGYIPSILGYINGGYSTDTTLFAPGTGEELVTAYVDMLHALKGE